MNNFAVTATGFLSKRLVLFQKQNAALLKLVMAGEFIGNSQADNAGSSNDNIEMICG
jgi:hypothetical protein